MNLDNFLSNELQIDAKDQLPSVSESLNDIIAPFLWMSVALTILFIALYIASILRRRKVERAIFDIQKVVNEINERDKARFFPPVSPPAHDDKIIAQKD